jgi:hypothetical protein
LQHFIEVRFAHLREQRKFSHFWHIDSAQSVSLPFVD